MPHLKTTCLNTLAVLGALLALSGSAIHAAVPDSVNYQGILKTSGGSPVPDGSYSVTLKIYSAASGPALALWAETQNVTTVGGAFSIILGVTTPLPPSIFSQPNRFLAIQVSPDPEMSPRTPIVAVPYAYRVATVDGATGGSVSGNISIEHSTSSAGNILKAGQLFIHDFGTGNTFVGADAGNLSMTGQYNVALGILGLTANTSGEYNTAVGPFSLESNTTGTTNTAAGAFALGSNLTGSDNTAIGLSALYSNTSGLENTATGTQALYTNSIGRANTANGENALFSNTSGDSNSATGYGALYHNTTADMNTASGYTALFSNTTGANNTATGSGALFSNTTGQANSAIGVNALNGNTTGASNTASGYWSLKNNTTGQLNTASGAFALRNNTTGSQNTASGETALQNSTSGVSNTADGYRSLFGNTTGNNNTASGESALSGTTTGHDNTSVGYSALISNVTGFNNTAIGSNADVIAPNLSNSTAIGANATVGVSNKIRLGNSAVTVIEGQVAYTFISDSTQKENFQHVDGDGVLQKICDWDLRSWNYKGQDVQQFRHYGPMAQEFFAAFGHDGVGTSGTPTTINAGDEVGILMIAVQELAKDKKQLSETVGALQAQIVELREMINSQANQPK